MAYSYKGAITFGLVYIPITLQLSIKEQDIGFNMIEKNTMSRVKYKKTCVDCNNKEVKNEDIVKGYQYEKDKYVIFTDKHPPDKLLPVIMLFMCFVGNFIPFGIVTAKGIKERNKARCRVGIWGLATIASLMATFVCFAYFGCACT